MQTLPLPPHFDPEKVSQVWRVPYEERAGQAQAWANKHQINPAGRDELRTCLVVIDVQNTFCIPGFELFVGGRSGTGAVEDNIRLCRFIYRNLNAITEITLTLDTHFPAQIFHALFLVDEHGNHPAPMTQISAGDISSGRWKFNAELASALGISVDYGQSHLAHYTRELKKSGKYELTIWPYHALLGGIGHAVVASVEEAVFFHSIARASQPDFILKGNNPFTEHYSAVGPEVLADASGAIIAEKNHKFIAKLRQFDRIIIAGQAKSHCVAWTVSDLIDNPSHQEKHLCRKVYLLEDCTSPVVIPGVIDFSEEADRAFQRFQEAGMHIVRATQPIETWPAVSKETARVSQP